MRNEGLAAQKAAVRDAARAARRAISPDARELATRAVESRVLELFCELAPNATVLAYRAISDELDPASTVAALRARGMRVAMPRVNAVGELDLCEASEICEYVRGPFGILEPVAGTPLLAPADLDAAIVPGLAFDRAGHRVGYGKGFYDRLLPALRPDCVTVGIAFEEQLVDALPHNGHDAGVDYVITPNATWSASAERDWFEPGAAADLEDQ